MSVASTPTASERAGLRWSLTLLASAAAVAVYFNALGNPFVYDDHRLIIGNSSLSALPNLHVIAFHEITRPLVNLTYAVDWSIWGLDPYGFHLTSVLLHGLNVALVFALAWRLASDAAVRLANPGTAPTLVAAATALVFAVNPMMTQAVGYISGRAELLCTAFLVLTGLATRRFIITSQRRWTFVAVATWFLAMLSKEVAIVAPLALILYDRWLSPPSTSTFRARFGRLYGQMLTLMLAVVVIRAWVLRQVEYPLDAFEPTYVLVQLEAVRRYAVLLLGQGPQSIFHQVDPFTSWLSARTLLTLMTVPAAILLIWGLYRLNRLAAFGAVWFLIFLLPSSALFILGRGEAMAEHRVYTASVGFFLAAGAVIENAWRLIQRQPARTRRLATLVACVLLAQLAMHTVLRNAAWSSPILLWRDAVSRAPGHWLPHLMLGEAFREAGQCDQAAPEYRIAIAGNPDEPLAYSHLGSCLLATSQLDDARHVFSALNARYPGSAEGLAGLGILAIADARLDEAQRLLNESLQRDSLNAPVRQLLAALERRQDPSYEAEFCQQVQGLVPFSQGALDCQRWRESSRP